MKPSAKIQKEIDEYKELLKSNAPADEKEFAKKEIEKLEKKLNKGDKEPKNPVAKKSAAGAKKRDRSNEKKINPRLSKLSFVAEGEKIVLTDANCFQVMTAFANRLEKAKAANGKYKTKPIIEKFTDSLEHTAEHAVKAVSQTRIENNPNDVIAGAKMMEAGLEKFFAGIEKMTGKKIPAEARKQIREILEGVQEKAEEAK